MSSPTAIGYLQIVFVALWGALFFAEYPDGWSVTGALLIVASTLALARRREIPPPAPLAPESDRPVV